MRRVSLIREVTSVEIQGKSLGVFSPTNVLRKKLAKVVIHNYFELFIFFVVILSSAMMAFEDPLGDPD